MQYKQPRREEKSPNREPLEPYTEQVSRTTSYTDFCHWGLKYPCAISHLINGFAKRRNKPSIRDLYEGLQSMEASSSFTFEFTRWEWRQAALSGLSSYSTSNLQGGSKLSSPTLVLSERDFLAAPRVLLANLWNVNHNIEGSQFRLRVIARGYDAVKTIDFPVEWPSKADVKYAHGTVEKIHLSDFVSACEWSLSYIRGHTEPHLDLRLLEVESTVFVQATEPGLGLDFERISIEQRATVRFLIEEILNFRKNLCTTPNQVEGQIARSFCAWTTTEVTQNLQPVVTLSNILVAATWPLNDNGLIVHSTLSLQSRLNKTHLVLLKLDSNAGQSLGGQSQEETVELIDDIFQMLVKISDGSLEGEIGKDHQKEPFKTKAEITTRSEASCLSQEDVKECTSPIRSASCKTFLPQRQTQDLRQHSYAATSKWYSSTRPSDLSESLLYRRLLSGPFFPSQILAAVRVREHYLAEFAERSLISAALLLQAIAATLQMALDLNRGRYDNESIAMLSLIFNSAGNIFCNRRSNSNIINGVEASSSFLEEPFLFVFLEYRVSGENFYVPSQAVEHQRHHCRLEHSSRVRSQADISCKMVPDVRGFIYSHGQGAVDISFRLCYFPPRTESVAVDWLLRRALSFTKEGIRILRFESDPAPYESFDTISPYTFSSLDSVLDFNLRSSNWNTVVTGHDADLAGNSPLDGFSPNRLRQIGTIGMWRVLMSNLELYENLVMVLPKEIHDATRVVIISIREPTDFKARQAKSITETPPHVFYLGYACKGASLLVAKFMRDNPFLNLLMDNKENNLSEHESKAKWCISSSDSSGCAFLNNLDTGDKAIERETAFCKCSLRSIETITPIDPWDLCVSTSPSAANANLATPKTDIIDSSEHAPKTFLLSRYINGFEGVEEQSVFFQARATSRYEPSVGRELSRHVAQTKVQSWASQIGELVPLGGIPIPASFRPGSRELELQRAEHSKENTPTKASTQPQKAMMNKNRHNHLLTRERIESSSQEASLCTECWLQSEGVFRDLSHKIGSQLHGLAFPHRLKESSSELVESFAHHRCTDQFKPHIEDDESTIKFRPRLRGGMISPPSTPDPHNLTSPTTPKFPLFIRNKSTNPRDLAPDAAKEKWSTMCEEDAFEMAEKQASLKGVSLREFMERRRAVRAKIKKATKQCQQDLENRVAEKAAGRGERPSERRPTKEESREYSPPDAEPPADRPMKGRRWSPEDEGYGEERSESASPNADEELEEGLCEYVPFNVFPSGGQPGVERPRTGSLGEGYDEGPWKYVPFNEFPSGEGQPRVERPETGPLGEGYDEGLWKYIPLDEFPSGEGQPGVERPETGPLGKGPSQGTQPWKRPTRGRLQEGDPESKSGTELPRGAGSRQFFNSSNGSSATSSSTSSLHRLFDSYRDNAKEEPDRIGVEGSMRYLQELGVKLDEPAVLTILAELNAPTMGEFTRDGFIDGWTNLRADTLIKQKQQVLQFRNSLTSNQALFKKTYKATFILARAPSQKILPLETAIDHWQLLLSPPSINWSTPSTPWLKWWIEFLQEKYKKAVSKDMWEQTAVFVGKSMEDESMGFWSEDGAWPSCIDDFVAFVREKRGTSGSGEEMDVG